MRAQFAAAVAAICFALAAPAPAPAAEITPHEKTLYEAAKKEGELTWYVAHYSAETAEAVGRAFTERYPEVKVNVVRSTAQVAFQRLSQDLRANAAQADVFSSTDVGHYAFLKDEGLLLKWKPQNAEGVLEAFKGLDPDDQYFITSAGLVLITYNKDKVKPEEAPKNWPDLLDPKWKGQVAVGHPGFSGYVGTWVVLMRKLYGWDYFKKLEANKPHIGRSINDTVTMLNAGESLVAAGPAATTLTSASRGNPLGLIYPTDGSLLMVSPSAIMKSAPHPNAAKLFMEFLLSPDHSKVAVQFFGESLRPEVAPAAGAKPLSEVKTIRPTLEEIEQGVPEVKELWRQTFGV